MDKYAKLWEIAGNKSRSEAMDACVKLGISRRSAYEELYGESAYEPLYECKRHSKEEE